ncbi:MAG: AraC family transcriptional regulator [Spongiibacteraceae bacterium]
MRTVTGASLSGCHELICKYGVDPDTIVRLSGMDPLALVDPDVVLDAQAVLRFFDFAAAACKERYFGIELAQCQGLEVLGAVWLVARHASTLGEALRNIGEAMALYSSAVVLRGEEESNGIAFCYDTVSGDAAGEVQAIELAFGLLCREVRACAGNKWMPAYVQFRHGKPTSLRRHHQVFGTSLQFNQDRNAVMVDSKTLQFPLHSADRSHAVMKRELGLRQLTLKEGFTSRVELIIRNLISSEICDAQTVSEALGMSARNLQKKLAKSGTNYQAILDKVREQLACKYLAESELSIAEIAELLQFSQSSAFSRFFSQRTGTSPRVYRNQYIEEHDHTTD